MDYYKQQIFPPNKLLLARLLACVSGSSRLRRDVNKPVDAKTIRKILVIEHQCIGDVLMLEPALNALRSHFKNAELHLLCVPAIKPLAQAADLAHKVFAYPGENPFNVNYDMLVNFHGDVRHIRLMRKFRARYRCGFSFSGGARYLTHVTDYPYQKHQVERPFELLSIMGVPAERTVPHLNLFHSVNEKTDIVLHPGAEHPSRRWPMSHWKELIRLFAAEGKEVFWLLPPGENTPDGISSIKGDLKDIAARIAASALLIGCDSMSVHLAASLETPALAIFGSQDPGLTGPYGSYGHVVRPEVACRHRRDDWRLCSSCMENVRPEAVFHHAMDILKDDHNKTQL